MATLTSPMALPLPDSPELRRLPIHNEARQVYKVLYETRDAPLTMQEIRARLPQLAGHEQLDRRKRELHLYFEIRTLRSGREFRYQLVDAKDAAADLGDGLSERERAACLAPGRCAMCGRTPLEDGIRLQCDHKIPRDWGGTNDPVNLQPLCEECNRGKKAHFATYNEFADQIRQAIARRSVHMRIGELLKAFGDKPVRSDLIGLVASAAEGYQEDWQKRLRELRILGWDIETTKKRDGGRTWAYYRLRGWRPWPEGNIRREIGRLERLRGYRRKSVP